MKLPPVTEQTATDIAIEDIAIEGIDEPVITHYFERLNSGDFQATSQLFGDEGAMQPPFEQPIMGANAIAAYLHQEAKGLTLQPKQGVVTLLENGGKEVEVSGKVQTPLFTVNVSWRFMLNPAQKILLAKIKLLASPKELLSLRQ